MSWRDRQKVDLAASNHGDKIPPEINLEPTMSWLVFSFLVITFYTPSKLKPYISSPGGRGRFSNVLLSTSFRLGGPEGWWPLPD